MKTLIAACVACALLAGCQSASTAPTGRPPAGTKNFKYSSHDGSTMMSAVEIRTRSATEGGVLIRDWIRANYPGYTIDSQELMRDEHRKKMFNMITILSMDNTAKRIYFDVTQFHRRYVDEMPNENMPRRQ
jgi:hypothetical protein